MYKCIYLSLYTAISKVVVTVNGRYWNRKEIWVQSYIASDKASAKVVTAWPWHSSKMNPGP